MPVEAQFIEAGIYQSCWRGVINAHDVHLSQEQVWALADQHGEYHYSLLLDATEFQRAEMSFQLVREVMRRDSKRMVGMVVVGASTYTQMMGKIFSANLGFPFTFTSNIPDAILFARRYLAEFQAKSADNNQE